MHELLCGTRFDFYVASHENVFSSRILTFIFLTSILLVRYIVVSTKKESNQCHQQPLFARRVARNILWSRTSLLAARSAKMIASMFAHRGSSGPLWHRCRVNMPTVFCRWPRR